MLYTQKSTCIVILLEPPLGIEPRPYMKQKEELKPNLIWSYAIKPFNDITSWYFIYVPITLYWLKFISKKKTLLKAEYFKPRVLPGAPGDFYGRVSLSPINVIYAVSTPKALECFA